MLRKTLALDIAQAELQNLVLTALD